MDIIIEKNYESMASAAASDLLKIMDSASHPLICPASGDTPAGLYRHLVNKISKEKKDISSWKFVGLDEWMGMNGADEGSCRYYLDQQLFSPLQVQEQQLCFFDGRNPNPRAECEKVEDFIRDAGGIQVAIVGLGMNGHIGMNEPGTDPSLGAHVSTLDTVTQQVGQKYFTKKQELNYGLTLGMASIMDARYILLLVSGKHKAEIVHKVFKGDITNLIPGSLLRNHPRLKVYLDQDAASLLDSLPYL